MSALQVELLPRAILSLDRVREYVQADNSEHGARWYLGLRRTIILLGKQPFLGRPTPNRAGVRQLVYGHAHNRYLIFYRVSRKSVFIVDIVHGMRKERT